MKATLKKQITELITGKEPKQDVLLLIEESPGIFSFRDKVVTEEEIIELQKGYEKTVKLVHYK